jgi:hypothetical protein
MRPLLSGLANSGTPRHRPEQRRLFAPTEFHLAPGAATGLRVPGPKPNPAHRSSRCMPCIGNNVRPHAARSELQPRCSESEDRSSESGNSQVGCGLTVLRRARGRLKVGAVTGDVRRTHLLHESCFASNGLSIQSAGDDRARCNAGKSPSTDPTTLKARRV